MKKLLGILLVLILGLGAGGGAAWGVGQWLGPPPEKPAHAVEEKVETAFIKAGPVVAPIVTEDEQLSGYASFELELEVPAEEADALTARLPLLLHAINLRSFRTPMAAGKQKILPDLDRFSALVMDAATESWGKGKLTRAVITRAQPM